MMNIKVIAFDADDTLWVNEPYFQNTEKKFCELLEEFLPQHTLSRELLKIEIENLALYGYGIKGYILSMIETALKVTDNTITNEAIEKIIGYGKELLNEPIELLDNVEEVLKELQCLYRIVVATKGDLLDQERKLKKSGLSHYFHHIEIMSEKGEDDYLKLIRHLDIPPDEFMMIGNSLKSDVIPVLNIGGHAIHIPYHTTWAHEHVETKLEHDNFRHVERLEEVLGLML
ncbi:MAG TPA: HAD family hydrolase [Mucilaginibacter sp.]|jgi:putative hydrolase of the HAD superfamily|nr:HAD family hydrolase [Mucilaginibacter sp.]